MISILGVVICFCLWWVGVQSSFLLPSLFLFFPQSVLAVGCLLDNGVLRSCQVSSLRVSGQKLCLGLELTLGDEDGLELEGC